MIPNSHARNNNAAPGSLERTSNPNANTPIAATEIDPAANPKLSSTINRNRTR